MAADDRHVQNHGATQRRTGSLTPRLRPPNLQNPLARPAPSEQGSPAMALTLALELAGLANGVPVEVVGNGEFDAGHLRLEIGIARALFTFDPALIAVGLLDVLALAGNGLGDTDVPTYIRSRTDLYDEHGREAGGWRVLAALTRGEGTVRLEGQLLDHRTHMEPGELIRTVEPWSALSQPLEPEGLLLSGAWQVETRRGNAYRGVSVAVVERDLLESVTRLEFGPVRVRRGTEGSVERITVEACGWRRESAGIWFSEPSVPRPDRDVILSG